MKKVFAKLFTLNQGYKNDRHKLALTGWDIGKVLEITDVDMGQSHTYLCFGEQGYFNSVNFIILNEDMKPYDIWSDPNFNPYI